MSTDQLSTRDAAERLGVSEASVRRWSDRGLIPVQRVGPRRERRFKPEDVEALPRRPAEPPRRDPAQVMLGGRPHNVPLHLAAFYDTDAGRVRLTAPFLGEGLLAGQPCILLAQGEELDSYLVALDAMPGVDVDRALASGLLSVVGAPGRTVAPALDFWEARLWAEMDRHAVVMRCVGEMVSERENFESEQEMLAYEAAVNQTLRRFPCAVICQYDVRQFSGQAILQAMRAHPDMFDASLSLLIK
jgi:excisionase family DNA binding protein